MLYSLLLQLCLAGVFASRKEKVKTNHLQQLTMSHTSRVGWMVRSGRPRWVNSPQPSDQRLSKHNNRQNQRSFSRGEWVLFNWVIGKSGNKKIEKYKHKIKFNLWLGRRKHIIIVWVVGGGPYWLTWPLLLQRKEVCPYLIPVGRVFALWYQMSAGIALRRALAAETKVEGTKNRR